MSKENGSSLVTWLVVLAVLCAAGGGAAWYFISKNASAPQFETASVSRGSLQQIVTASGQLDPVLNVQVGSQISGIIKSLNADFNSVVKSNQVIAQIDPSTYQIGVLKARAQLSNSVANLQLSKLQAQRADALFADKLLSSSDHDTALAQLQQAQAQVDTDAASLKSAEVDLSRCTIYAPVDGVVISRSVDVGQTVAASFNTPTLFLIANDLSKMQIDALVSEADIGGVIVGQNVNFGVDAYPFRIFHGAVSQIRYGPITNQNVVNYDAVIGVKNDDLKLLPGMTANVSIIVAERDDVLRIPNAALRFHPPDSMLPGGTNTAESTVAAGRAGGTGGGPGGGGGGAGRPGGFGGGGGPGGGLGGPGGGGRGGGGPAGGRGAGGGARADRASSRTVYVLSTVQGSGKQELKPVKIKTGINDGANTEVLDGLTEGDQVVIGMTVSDASQAARSSNPFGGGGGGPFRR